MASQRELQTPHGETNSMPINEDVTSAAKKKRIRPASIDVRLAHSYKAHQDLPSAQRGVNTKLEAKPESKPCPTVANVKITPEEYLRADQRPLPPYKRGGHYVGYWGSRKDRISGRKLSEYGGPCLRCTGKGLRCTLTFFGKDNEYQCAACRRSGVAHCVRLRPFDEDRKPLPHYGPPWENPNYFTGTPEDGKPASISEEALKEILRDFYDGDCGYVLGNYVPKKGMCNFALPPFNGADLPLADRPENQASMTWKDALPTWQNQSLVAAVDAHEDWRQHEKMKLSLARDPTTRPLTYTQEERADMGTKDMVRIVVMTRFGYTEWNYNLLRYCRRYMPRENNMIDVLGETW
ncbi:hypothetical protein F4802DRAFT_548479 [Xylaria palmicola]|nr:hypothetical protein F4802DRAFT_548479 [Xylaria palmicola]